MQYRDLAPLRAAVQRSARDADAHAALSAGLLIHGEAEEAQAAAERAVGIEDKHPIGIIHIHDILRAGVA